MDGPKHLVIPDLADREAIRRWDETNERLRFSVEYAQAGLKALVLSNGGAIIALLTFVGNTTRAIHAVGLKWAFAWFFIGLVTVLISYVFAYWSQGHAMNASFNRSLQAQSDARGLGQSYDFEDYERKCISSERAAVICAVGSLVSFGVGSFVALDAIT